MLDQFYRTTGNGFANSFQFNQQYEDDEDEEEDEEEKKESDYWYNLQLTRLIISLLKVNMKVFLTDYDHGILNRRNFNYLT